MQKKKKKKIMSQFWETSATDDRENRRMEGGMCVNGRMDLNAFDPGEKQR